MLCLNLFLQMFPQHPSINIKFILLGYFSCRFIFKFNCGLVIFLNSFSSFLPFAQHSRMPFHIFIGILQNRFDNVNFTHVIILKHRHMHIEYSDRWNIFLLTGKFSDTTYDKEVMDFPELKDVCFELCIATMSKLREKVLTYINNAAS